MPKRGASTPPVAENDTVSLLPSQRKKAKLSSPNPVVCFVGKPIPVTEARAKWPHRYPSEGKKKGSSASISKEATGEDNEVMLATCHYRQAKIDGVVFNLHDDAYVKAEDGKPDYIARIVELFATVDNGMYFMARWFYRAEDTVIKSHGDLVDKKRVFLSDVKDENPLDCIVSKVNIVKLTPNVGLTTKERKIPPCDYYYDMTYTLPYLTFSNVVNDTVKSESDASSTISSESGSSGCFNGANLANGKTIKKNSSNSSEWALLDLYSGCGAMSTGLCLGASLAGVKLVTRWAVDINAHACKSLKQNHPETQVRNEPAENFLALVKAWAKLCEEFSLLGSERSESGPDMEEDEIDDEDVNVKTEESEDHSDSEDFEVEKLLAVCHGDPNNVKKSGLYFKVRWMGYDSSYDTWEPIDGLSDCKDVLKNFVTKGYKKKLLPLPGDANFICGGPPCQGVSGFNRFRNAEAPLEDIKNKQLIVYMDIIDFLKPKYILMENVVDILKFSGGYLGRYAIGRLVAMNYQARMGMMAAGSYGLPQFRMRVFLWGARPTEKLPPYPLPTHEVVSRGFVPTEFEEITVTYNNKETCKLGEALLLEVRFRHGERHCSFSWTGMADKDEESAMPRDAKIVKSLLKSMGVGDYEPPVIHTILELWYRYIVDVLTDAQVYSEHAGKSEIDCDDVKLAIQSKLNFSFSQPPPREVLLELAQNRNKIPLPKTVAGPGIPLPPDQDTLISPNYMFGIPSQGSEPEETEDEETTIPNPSQEEKIDMQQQELHQRVSFPLPKSQKD